ncbi:hypothetical protein PI124_g11517 [Phytophthora idaei]|nr:hypothetical protein PI124_g11517 [Phytophthora idaei]
MDKALVRECLKEPRAICADPRGRPKTVFLGNCSGHLEEEESQEELQRLNARLSYLPANATDLCQPADSFVIAKIEDVWARMWNNKKIELIEDKEWQNKVRKNGSYSGKLKNPGKTIFLKMAAAAVKEEIVRKYPEEFEGTTKDKDKTISDDSENTLSEDNATEQTAPAIVMNDAGDEDLLSIKRN